jgi:hypothetical protein
MADRSGDRFIRAIHAKHGCIGPALPVGYIAA